MIKKHFTAILLTLALALSLCACAPSTPTEVDTTTKFSSPGHLALSIPNEYLDLLVVKTADATGAPAVYEKASVEAEETLYPGEDWGAGWLFSLGSMNEYDFHKRLCYGAMGTGAEVFARSDNGDYYIFYHPTDVGILRDGETTDADWEQWSELCEWAAGVPDTVIADNPGLIPYQRTYTVVDEALCRILYEQEEATFSRHDRVFTPTFGQVFPLVQPLSDSVMFRSVWDVDPTGEYVSLQIPSAHWRFDFFTDEGQQHYVRQVFFSDGMEQIYVADCDGQFFPIGQVVSDWLESLS